MTNDTNTLNGALQELGETMASNLQAKGVTASASDGLTTLAGKILTIPSGGSCYHIEFSEDSYVAVGGTATLEIMLQENYAPKSGATVTVTGSDSSLYTGITNTDGIAQVTVSNVSGTVTFTGSYSNVSAQCTVTASQVLFYDACDSTYKSSEYGTIIKISSSTTTNYTAYDSGQNAYKVRANGDWGILPITSMTGKDNYKITAYFKPAGTNNHLYRAGFGFVESGTTSPSDYIWLAGNGVLHYTHRQGSTENNTDMKSNITISVYHKLEVIKQGSSYTFTCYDTDDTTVLETTTKTLTMNNVVVGLMVCCGSSYGSYVKEIKAESL